MKCVECGGTIITDYNGAKVCSECGLVHSTECYEDDKNQVFRHFKERDPAGKNLLEMPFPIEFKGEFLKRYGPVIKGNYEQMRFLYFYVYPTTQIRINESFIHAHRFFKLNELQTHEFLRSYLSFYKILKEDSHPLSHFGALMCAIYYTLYYKHHWISLDDVRAYIRYRNSSLSLSYIRSLLTKYGFELKDLRFKYTEDSLLAEIMEILLILKDKKIISPEWRDALWEIMNDYIEVFVETLKYITTSKKYVGPAVCLFFASKYIYGKFISLERLAKGLGLYAPTLRYIKKRFIGHGIHLKLISLENKLEAQKIEIPY